MKTKILLPVIIISLLLSNSVCPQVTIQTNWGNKNKDKNKDSETKTSDNTKPKTKTFTNFGTDKAKLKEYHDEYYYLGDYLNDYIRPIEDYASAVIFTDSLNEEYDGYWTNPSNGEMYGMYNVYKETISKMKEFSTMISSNYTDAYNQGIKSLKSIITTAESFKTSLTDTANWNYSIGGTTKDVNFYIAAQKFLKGENDENAGKLMAEKITTLEKVKTLKNETQVLINEKYAAAVLAAKEKAKQDSIKYAFKQIQITECPVDKYLGADKEVLKAKVKAIWDCNKYQIVKVYITEAQWEREKGERWDDLKKAYVYYDKSYLYVDVICKRTDGTGDAYLVQINLMLNNVSGVYSTDALCSYVEDKVIPMSIVK